MPAYQRCVFRKEGRIRIVNLRDFSGTDANSENWIFCGGFTEDGKPILNPKLVQNAAYKVAGGFIGGVSWSPMMAKGFLLHDLLGLTVEETDRLIGAYVGSGVKSLSFCKQHELDGMVEPYDCADKWRVLVDRLPNVSYDKFNELLKKISSDWRIYTSRIGKLLRKLEFQSIMGIKD